MFVQSSDWIPIRVRLKYIAGNTIFTICTAGNDSCTSNEELKRERRRVRKTKVAAKVYVFQNFKKTVKTIAPKHEQHFCERKRCYSPFRTIFRLICAHVFYVFVTTCHINTILCIFPLLRPNATKLFLF